MHPFLLVVFNFSFRINSLASCTEIIAFNPANNTSMNGVEFPVVFTFSEEVSMWTGCIVFENDFGDLTKICDEASGITISDKNATVQQKEKFYYGSSYKVYFEESPFVDSQNSTVILNRGDYVFHVNSTHFM